MTTTETISFTEAAAYRLRLAERAYTRAHEAAAVRSASESAKWSMRDLVIAETEQQLYAVAAGEHGEERFVMYVARYLADHTRDTDTFARAATEANREAAMNALRNLRGEMSAESLIELVSQL